MSRLPFDFDAEAGNADDHGGLTGSGSGAGRRDEPWTVSQTAMHIREAVAAGLPGKVRVLGEVSNFSDRRHWFFSLKDDAATLRCVCFASNARRVGCEMADGMQVIATGRVDFYDAQGHVQLYVDRIEPAGLGDLERRLRELMQQLRELGYFDQARKRPLPMMPRRVAVVTSQTGAAVRDFIRIARQRFAGVALSICDVRVQGAQAAGEVAAAIRALSEHGPAMGVDVVVVTRGGGSLEDLWAFNERIVADAIYDCRLPVVAAIGHEVDTTVAELVADLRCATPSHAAQAVIPEQHTLMQQITQMHRRLTLTMRRRLSHERHRLQSAQRHPVIRRPDRVITVQRERLNQQQRRLHQTLPRRWQMAEQAWRQAAMRLPTLVRSRQTEARQQLDMLARRLEALSPQRVLERGYSYTVGPDGQIIRDPSQVQAGQRIETRLAKGRLTSRVEEPQQASTEAMSAPASESSKCSKPSKSRKRQTRRSRHSDGPTLFD